MNPIDVCHKAFQIVQQRIPINGILPEKLTLSSLDASQFMLTADFEKAYKASRSVPDGSSLGVKWWSIQQKINSDYRNTYYQLLPYRDVTDFSLMVCSYADKIFTENPTTIREKIKNFISEHIAFHLDIIVASETRKLAKLDVIEPHERCVNLIAQGYSIGGWPSGWIGEYPNGKPILYRPYDAQGNWNQGELELDF